MIRGTLSATSLLVLAAPAIAQLGFPNCTDSSLDWSFNSLKQNPCNVAVYLEASCNGGQFNIPPLPPNTNYRGPNAGQGNPCICSTVLYSLISACGSCQGSGWTQWSEWSLNCTSVSVASFPNPIPGGTRAPHWAFLDVTKADTWNAAAAQSAGEASPSSTSAPQQSSHHKSHAGAIAGGVVGGIVGAALLGALAVWFIRRRKLRAEAQPSPYMSGEPVVAEAFGTGDSDTFPQHKLYNPNDPSTFPPSMRTTSPSVVHTTYNSDIGHGGTASPPPRNQYNGLPLV
ncbi:hypothetical protein BC834DRAFT_604199 [Gloeopeniophorella convolvens]|nr:hypothetical protein BC834DRAFT_604199 [Gloeopeniophorella convolvens]